MKTFYLMQGGALEDYLNGSSSQGRESYGKGKDDDCKPFTPCWCESHPQGYDHPQCDEQTPTASISSFGYSMLIVFLITVVVWTKFFDKSK